MYPLATAGVAPVVQEPLVKNRRPDILQPDTHLFQYNNRIMTGETNSSKGHY